MSIERYLNESLIIALLTQNHLNEDSVMTLVRQLFEHFGWQGAVFTADDIRTEIELVLDGNGAAIDSDRMSTLVAAATERDEWVNLTGVLTNRGHECITNLVASVLREPDALSIRNEE